MEIDTPVVPCIATMLVLAAVWAAEMTRQPPLLRALR